MHDILKLLLFGSYRNIDEMNHEKAHQRSKQQAQLDNSRIAIEKSLLQRVLFSLILEHSLSIAFLGELPRCDSCAVSEHHPDV
jgi:hypothetical protein